MYPLDRLPQLSQAEEECWLSLTVLFEILVPERGFECLENTGGREETEESRMLMMLRAPLNHCQCNKSLH